MSSHFLFVQPRYVTHIVAPPLGIGYLASYLEREGHKVSFLDLNLTHLDEQEFQKRLREYAPDFVGVSVLCTNPDKLRDTIRAIKDAIDVPVVAGGAQVSASPEHTLRYINADYAVVGEGEITLTELVGALEKGDDYTAIPGLGYLSNDRFILNPRRPLIEDLDTLPLPTWDLMPPKDYRIAPILSSARAFPIAPILTSRGCPYDCTFCAGKIVWGRTYRYRSAVSVVDEIELLQKDFGVKEIFISDDNFNLKASHASEVCEEILRRKIKIHWACPNGLRVDALTPELLELMKRAGCHLIGLGIESGVQEIADRAKKSLDLSIVARVCDEIDKAGIKAVGFFILGLPGETVDTIRETVEFAKRLPLKRAWFNILSPYPGSEVFDEFACGKDVDALDWERLTTVGRDVAQLTSVTPEELDRLQKKAARSFYSRPSILVDVLISQRPSTVGAFFRSQFFRGMFRTKQGSEEGSA